jgi:hypothetical protein
VTILDAGARKRSMGRMALVALTLGLVIAVLGAVAIVDPTVLLAISRPFLTPIGLYAAAVLRLILGTALFVSAPTSRAPTTIRTLGVVIIVAGLITPLIGIERARAMVAWWSDRGTIARSEARVRRAG